jgi:hypothetical protein
MPLNVGGARIGRAVVELVGENALLKRSIAESQWLVASSMKQVAAKAAVLGTSMQAAGRSASIALTAPFLLMGKVAADEFTEVREVNAQTAAGLKSTGEAANITAKEIRGLSDRIGELAGRDAEEVQAAENVLLTFQRVRNEVGEGNKIFDRASLSIANVSARLGKDLNGAAIQVGKALNDPIRGVTALGRAGVQFTEQQREQITTLVESGRQLEAQKIILHELQIEFGGSAKAAGRALGPFERIRLSFNDMAESIGRILMPVLRRMSAIFSSLSERFQGLSPQQRRMAVQVAAIAAAVGPLLIVLGKLVSVFALLAAHPVILAIAAVAAGFVLAYKKSETFRVAVDRLVAAVGPLMESLRPLARFVGSVLVQAFKVWVVYVTHVVNQVTALVNVMVRAIETARRLAEAVGNLTGVGNDVAGSSIAQQVQANLAAQQAGGGVRAGAGSDTGGQRKALGGPVLAGHRYLVGERGPEFFVPRSNGSIVPNNHLGLDEHALERAFERVMTRDRARRQNVTMIEGRRYETARDRRRTMVDG